MGKKYIDLTDFKADRFGVYDSTHAIMEWFDRVLSTGKTGYVPSGNYLVSKNMIFDLSVAADTGIKIIGDGIGRSTFSSTVSTGPAFSFLRSGATSGNMLPWFYSSVLDIGFVGNTDGPVVSIGNANLFDQCNDSRFRIMATNSNGAAGCVAIQANALYNCDLMLVGNCSGSVGDSLQVNQTQFSTFRGSCGNANNAIHITNGYSYGNSFLSMDLEASNYCITQDSADAINNIFVGGQFDANTAILNLSAGDMELDNVNYASSPIFSGNSYNFATIKGSRSQNSVGTPSVPASGVAYQNQSGRPVDVVVYGAATSSIAINSAVLSATGGTIPLSPGDSITLNYSTAPSWVWIPRY